MARAIAATATAGGHDGGLDIGVVAAANDAEQAIRWSVEAAVAGVIGNAIYDKARRAVARFLRRSRDSAVVTRIEDTEAADIARFAFAHAGVPLCDPSRYDGAVPAESVVRFDGKCIVRFVREQIPGRVQMNGLEMLWDRHEVFEALIPDTNPDMRGVKYRTYIVNADTPKLTEGLDHRMTRRILDAWPQVRQTLSDTPGERRSL